MKGSEGLKRGDFIYLAPEAGPDDDCADLDTRAVVVEHEKTGRLGWTFLSDEFHGGGENAQLAWVFYFDANEHREWYHTQAEANAAAARKEEEYAEKCLALARRLRGEAS